MGFIRLRRARDVYKRQKQHSQRPQCESGEGEQNGECGSEGDGEPHSHVARIRKCPADGSEGNDNQRGNTELQAARPPERQPCAKPLRAFFHKPAQHEHGANGADIKQWWQAKENRSQQACTCLLYTSRCV